MGDVSDQEIIETLNFSGMSEEIQQRAVDAAHTTVELRTMGLLDEMLNDEQAGEFHTIKEQQGDGPAWDYLNRTLGADVNDLYQSTMRDYLEQHKNDQENLPF